MKRRIAWILLFFTLFALSTQAGAVEADIRELRIEQVQIEMPSLRAYFYLEADDAPQVSAELGNRQLETVQVRRYDSSLDATSYFFLVDCSTSISSAQMRAVRSALKQFAEEMGAKDTFTLISFGVDVQVLLMRETDPERIAEAVDALKADQRGTQFFNALAKAINLADNSAYALERKVAFVFSDSVDYNVGGYTRDEINKLLSATGLPFYAMGFSNGTKEKLDNFGGVSRTSGGTISIVTANNLRESLITTLASIRNAWVAELAADSNVVESRAQEFTLTVPDGGQKASMQVPVRFWRPDNAPPTVLEVVQQSPESIRVQLSEPVQGAQSTENFVVRDEKGDLLGIRAVAYNEAESSITLSFQTPPRSGQLTIEFPSITDLSMEKNKIAGGTRLQFAGTDPTPVPTAEPTSSPSPTPHPTIAPTPQPTAEPEPEATLDMPILIGGAALLLLLVILLVVIMVRRRNKQRQAEPEAWENTPPDVTTPARTPDITQIMPQEGDVQVHFVGGSSPQLPHIRLSVSAAGGQSRVLEVPVNKTLFVGRSNICDVYFDDPTMSRQHFVISRQDGAYTITNLSETRGTLLNGVPLQNPLKLQNGDIITAGQHTLAFFAVPTHEGTP